LLLCLLINGCGSSNHASATPRSPPPAPATSSAGAPATQESTSARTAATPPPGTRQTAATSTAGASNVRLPATFVITAHGSITPQTVSAPAGVTIQLTVSSGDGHAHQVVLRTGRGGRVRILTVPTGGLASATLTRLEAGRYTLEVDGTPAGALIIGAQPGP
jgi:hypothetical protein